MATSFKTGNKQLKFYQMKKLSIYLLSSCLFTASMYAQNAGAFVLKGYVTNLKEGKIYLNYPNAEGKYVSDSVALQNGVFRFEGKIAEPVMVGLSGKTKSRSVEDPNTTRFFISPGETNVMLADQAFRDAVIVGSPLQDEYAELVSEQNKIAKRWKPIMDTLSAINKRSNVQFQETKNWVLTPYHAETKEITDRFLTTHPTSFVTAYLLRFERGISDMALQGYYDRFPEKVQNSSYGKALKEELDNRKKGVPGAMAAAFTTKDLEGKTLSLNDYKGKYVLLDFWASWCVPCRKGNPHLKELYAKYKGKGFEVIGVTDDDRNPDAWKKAVEKDELPWKTILRGLKMTVNGDNVNIDRTNDISSRYNISSLPTQVLIDPNGKIIGRYGGDGGEIHDALDEKLAELLK
jgi:thiol-disulfide isomerase/thioredoxin